MTTTIINLLKPNNIFLKSDISYCIYCIAITHTNNNMPIYTVCSCGTSLSDLRDYYVAMRTARLNELASQYDKNYTELNPQLCIDLSVRVKMGDVLDDLNLTKDCCRMRMISYDEETL